MKSTKSKTAATNATQSLFERLKRGGDNQDTLKKSLIVAALKNKHNLSPEEISSLSGISPAHVYNMLKINAMNAKIKSYIKNGRIGATDALHLARRQPSEKAYIAAIESFIKDKESATQQYADASILRKESIFKQQKKFNNSNREKLERGLENLLSKFSPTKVSSSKIKMFTGIISQLIAE